MSEKEQAKKRHCDLENFVIASKYVVVLLLNDHISSQCLVIQEITIFRFLQGQATNFEFLSSSLQCFESESDKVGETNRRRAY